MSQTSQKLYSIKFFPSRETPTALQWEAAPVTITGWKKDQSQTLTPAGFSQITSVTDDSDSLLKVEYSPFQKGQTSVQLNLSVNEKATNKLSENRPPFTLTVVADLNPALSTSLGIAGAMMPPGVGLAVAKALDQRVQASAAVSVEYPYPYISVPGLEAGQIEPVLVDTNSEAGTQLRAAIKGFDAQSQKHWKETGERVDAQAGPEQMMRAFSVESGKRPGILVKSKRVIIGKGGTSASKGVEAGTLKLSRDPSAKPPASNNNLAVPVQYVPYTAQLKIEVTPANLEKFKQTYIKPVNGERIEVKCPNLPPQTTGTVAWEIESKGSPSRLEGLIRGGEVQLGPKDNAAGATIELAGDPLTDSDPVVLDVKLPEYMLKISKLGWEDKIHAFGEENGGEFPELYSAVSSAPDSTIEFELNGEYSSPHKVVEFKKPLLFSRVDLLFNGQSMGQQIEDGSGKARFKIGSGSLLSSVHVSDGPRPDPNTVRAFEQLEGVIADVLSKMSGRFGSYAERLRASFTTYHEKFFEVYLEKKEDEIKEKEALRQKFVWQTVNLMRYSKFSMTHYASTVKLYAEAMTDLVAALLALSIDVIGLLIELRGKGVEKEMGEAIAKETTIQQLFKQQKELWEAAQKKLGALVKQLEEASGLVKSLFEKVRLLKEKIDDLARWIAKLNEDLHEYSRQIIDLDEYIKSAGERAKALADRITGLQRSVAETGRELTELKNRKVALSTTRQQLEGQVKEAVEKTAESETKHEAEQAAAKTAGESHSLATKNFSQAEGAWKQAKSEVNAAETALGNTRRELSAVEGKLGEISTRVPELERKLAAVEAELSDPALSGPARSAKQAERAQLEQNLSTLYTERLDLEPKKTNLAAKESEASERLQSARINEEKCRGNYDKGTEDLNIAAGEKKKADLDAEQAANQLSECRGSQSKLESDHSDTRRELQETETGISERETAYSRDTNELQRCQSEHAQLDGELSQKKVKRDEVQAAKNETQAKIEGTNAQLEKDKKSLEAKSQELDTAQKNASKLESEKDLAEQEAKKAEQTFQETSKSYEKCEEMKKKYGESNVDQVKQDLMANKSKTEQVLGYVESLLGGVWGFLVRRFYDFFGQIVEMLKGCIKFVLDGIAKIMLYLSKFIRSLLDCAEPLLKKAVDEFVEGLWQWGVKTYKGEDIGNKIGSKALVQAIQSPRSAGDKASATARVMSEEEQLIRKFDTLFFEHLCMSMEDVVDNMPDYKCSPDPKTSMARCQAFTNRAQQIIQTHSAARQRAGSTWSYRSFLGGTSSLDMLNTVDWLQWAIAWGCRIIAISSAVTIVGAVQAILWMKAADVVDVVGDLIKSWLAMVRLVIPLRLLMYLMALYPRAAYAGCFVGDADSPPQKWIEDASDKWEDYWNQSTASLPRPPKSQ